MSESEKLLAIVKADHEKERVLGGHNKRKADAEKRCSACPNCGRYNIAIAEEIDCITGAIDAAYATCRECGRRGKTVYRRAGTSGCDLVDNAAVGWLEKPSTGKYSARAAYYEPPRLGYDDNNTPIDDFSGGKRNKTFFG